jgi:mannosyl-oligosaccharide alpha-1,2-mannosidase
MYEKALTAMKRNIFFRPMTKEGIDILFAGNVDSDGATPLDQLKTNPEAQHLGCFSGGMVGIAARIFGNEAEMATARRLMEGCLWVYEASTQGILPEIIQTLKCDNPKSCPWDEQKWIAAMDTLHGVEGKDAAEEKQKELGFPAGILQAKDARYILRYDAFLIPRLA